MTRTVRLLVLVGAATLVVLALAGRDGAGPGSSPDDAPTTAAATAPSRPPAPEPSTTPTTAATSGPPSTRSPTGPPPPGATAGAELAALLDELTVAPPDPGQPGYDREAFEEGLDADGDCLRTRHEVLQEESLVPATVEDCHIVAGRWRDPLSGAVGTDPADLQVDHLVALADAWRSGAWTWSDDRRAAYANALGDPDHLNALTAAENQRKADDGPEAYRPPDPTAWCWYGTAYARIKVTWELTVTEAQRAGLDDLLAACAGG